MMDKRLTIYDIKRLTEQTSPYFFDRKTLRFFGQTMKSFSVGKMDDGRYFVSAPIIKDGKQVGRTERIFDPATNRLIGGRIDELTDRDYRQINGTGE